MKYCKLFIVFALLVWSNMSQAESDEKEFICGVGLMKDALTTGEHLATGEKIQSKNNRYELVMQNDGNLCIYALTREGKRGVWCSTVHGFKGGILKMQDDGNLVVYDNNNKAKWSSETHPYFNKVFKKTSNKPVKLTLGNDGILRLYTAANKVVWTNKKGTIIKDGPKKYVLKAGEKLAAGGGNSKLYSKNNQYRLVMQNDGNLCIYKFTNGKKQGVWCNMVHGFKGATLRMQKDGNLVVYNNNDKPKWSSETHPYFNKVFKDTSNKPVKLILGNDGILRLYTTANKVVWTNK